MAAAQGCREFKKILYLVEEVVKGEHGSGYTGKIQLNVGREEKEEEKPGVEVE